MSRMNPIRVACVIIVAGIFGYVGEKNRTTAREAVRDKEKRMNTPIRILGIPGSLRRESNNRAALGAAATLLPVDATLEIFGLDGIHPYNQDIENDATASMRRHVRALKLNSSAACVPDNAMGAHRCDHAGVRLPLETLSSRCL